MARTPAETPANPPAEAPAPAPALDLTALTETTDFAPTPAEVKVPDEIKAFVKAGHEAWKKAPKKWRSVALANADLVKQVTKMSRDFAKASGLTFRVNKASTTDTRLVYKVTDKFQNNGASEEAQS